MIGLVTQRVGFNLTNNFLDKIILPIKRRGEELSFLYLIYLYKSRYINPSIHDWIKSSKSWG